MSTEGVRALARVLGMGNGRTIESIDLRDNHLYPQVCTCVCVCMCVWMCGLANSQPSACVPAGSRGSGHRSGAGETHAPTSPHYHLQSHTHAHIAMQIRTHRAGSRGCGGWCWRATASTAMGPWRCWSR
jgi:hypothetical protein